MSCTHAENFFASRTNGVAIDAILHCMVFPITEKAIKYKASLFCCLCHSKPIEKHPSRPSSLLACAHCIHFACLTNGHIEHHANAQPDHHISICLERGELYCSVCRDFVYSQRTETSYQHALSLYMNRFGLSDRPWRPIYKELEFVSFLQPLSLPSNIPGSRRTRGLVNMGNTCFLNVVVQALTHTPILRDFLLSDLHRCDNPSRSRNCLACEMIRITQEIYRPAASPYVPSNLLHSIWLHASHLAGYEQRDAHEFLITLLTLIHTHLVGEQAPREDDADDPISRGSSKHYVADEKSPIPINLLLSSSGNSRSASPLSTSSRTQHPVNNHNHHGLSASANAAKSSSGASSTTGEMDDRVACFSCSGPPSPASTGSGRTDIINSSNNCGGNSVDVSGSTTAATSDNNCDCIVHQVFFGDLESVISYQGCDHRSSTVDPFLDLSLDVAQRGSTSLDACLASYFRPETIDGLIFCSQCNIRRPAVKQFSLLHLPNVLCFYLKRCHHDTKINTSISFPEQLDLTPFVAQLSETPSSWQDKYSLYAVLNHSGHTNSGHYTAFIRSGPGCWCLCDDQKIVSVTLDHVLTTDAYVLLYHKNLLAFRSSVNL